MVKVPRRTKNSYLWKQAEKRAAARGHKDDIDYILSMFKRMGGSLKSTLLNEIGVY